MNLHQLVKDPTRLKTYKTHVSPEEAYKRLRAGNKTPGLVNIVARDPGWAYWYARNIIKDRWPMGEPAIAQDPLWAYLYARDIIRGPWPEAGIK